MPRDGNNFRNGALGFGQHRHGSSPQIIEMQIRDASFLGAALKIVACRIWMKKL
jgi:hypothetical protein